MRTIHFTVDRLEFIGSGKFMLAGRNCRDDLHKGDLLHVRSRDGAESVVVFCVDEITMYNRTVEMVPTAYTAGLFFPNSLASEVRLGDELHGQAA